MRDTQNQDTYLSCAELLNTEAGRCERAASDLKAHMGTAPEPFSDALREAAALEQELATLMRDYAARGPKHVVETRLQYTADSEEHSDPKSPEDALVRLTDINKEISEKLLIATRNEIPAEVAEELDTLWRDIDKLCRKISMIHVTMQDV